MALNRMEGRAGSCGAGIREVLVIWEYVGGTGKVRLEGDNTSGRAVMKKAREGRSRGVSARMTEQRSALGETRGGIAAGGVVSCSLRAGATGAGPVVGAATAGERCTMAGARDATAGNMGGSRSATDEFEERSSSRWPVKILAPAPEGLKRGQSPLPLGMRETTSGGTSGMESNAMKIEKQRCIATLKIYGGMLSTGRILGGFYRQRVAWHGAPI